VPGALQILFRQLTAHRAFVARRAISEVAALALLRAAPAFPRAALWAHQLHPNHPGPLAFLAAQAERGGDSDRAIELRGEALRRTHNTYELSVLESLSQTLALRRARTSPRREPSAVARAVDAELRSADTYLSAGESGSAAEAAHRACALDSGRFEAWLALGEAQLASGNPEAACGVLLRAIDLAPTQIAPRRALAAAQVLSGDRLAAERTYQEAIRRHPGPEIARELVALRSQQPPDARVVSLSLSQDEQLELTQGDRTTVHLELRVEDGTVDLLAIEPFGSGVLCQPNRWTRFSAGHHDIAVEVLAERPDAVCGGNPWQIVFIACGAETTEQATLEVAVSSESAGHVHYVVTEDHELYDERTITTARDARMTLVDKSRLAEKIANEKGARWTHMVDVASLALVDWAAGRSSKCEWGEVAESCREHLIDAVAHGNDLGLHLHDFHDPAGAGFCHGFDTTSDEVTTDAAFLEAPQHERGFWSRAYPALGDVDQPGTRAHATWRAIGRLEALGRLGDPRFRVALFRAGSFDFGRDSSERARSLSLLSRLGIPADSDFPKPRLYHRPPETSAYPVGHDVAEPEWRPAKAGLLELRPEYNIESDFLSDRRVMSAYVERRIASLLGPDSRLKWGPHVLCSMTHDKFINFRMGKRWDQLRSDYGDWVTIADHLADVSRVRPPVRFSTARGAVLDWYDHRAPELTAWRDEEIVVVSRPGVSDDVFRYGIVLLGRDIPVHSERTHTVVVTAPAWPVDDLRSLRIERDGRRWPSRQLSAGPPRLEFVVDSKSAAWELVVCVAGSFGIQGEAVPGEPGLLRVTSRCDYRSASIELPLPDGSVRVRNVCLKPSAPGEGGLPMYSAMVKTHSGRGEVL